MQSNLRENQKNRYQLIMRVDENSTDILLFFGEKEIDGVRVEPNRELLEKLLPAIDELLSKHSLSSKDITDIRVKSDLPDGYSSRRIAETVARTWRLEGRLKNE